jgi:hypothetical protein
MSYRFTAILARASAVATLGALALAGGASAASSLPTMHVALNGARGISISGAPASGAVSFTATFSGKLPKGAMGAAFGIVRLDPGATIQQAAGAVQSHRGDLNALDPYASLFVVADAPGTVQSVLTPGNYVALNLTSNGQPGFAPFTVTQASAPAALPKASQTQAAIEFGFRGPTVLHDGTIVRAENQGYLVHMISFAGVPSVKAGKKVMALLKAGKDNAALKDTNGSFFDLLGPASPGAMQQEVLRAKPGYYVEACFMDTIDGREHTRLGMERLVRVVN